MLPRKASTVSASSELESTVGWACAPASAVGLSAGGTLSAVEQCQEPRAQRSAARLAWRQLAQAHWSPPAPRWVSVAQREQRRPPTRAQPRQTRQPPVSCGANPCHACSDNFQPFGEGLCTVRRGADVCRRRARRGAASSHTQGLCTLPRGADVCLCPERRVAASSYAEGLCTLPRGADVCLCPERRVAASSYAEGLCTLPRGADVCLCPERRVAASSYAEGLCTLRRRADQYRCRACRRAASSYAGGRPGSERAARNERSSERGRGAQRPRPGARCEQQPSRLPRPGAPHDKHTLWLPRPGARCEQQPSRLPRPGAPHDKHTLWLPRPGARHDYRGSSCVEMSWLP